MKRGWLLVILFAALAGWTSQDAGSSPFGDGPYRLGIAMQVAHEMREGWLGPALSHLASVVAPYPAGALALPTLLYSALGPSPLVPILASWLCLLLLYDGMARLVRVTWPDAAWWWAPTAWATLAGSALVLQATERHAVELPLAALLVQGCSWIAASSGLTRRRASVLAGICFGLALLVKYSAPVYLLPIFALVVGSAIRRRLSGHLIDLLGLTLVVGLPFYLWNRPWILETFSLPEGLGGAERWLFHPAVVIEAVGWPGLLGGVAGLVLAWRSAGRQGRDLLLAGGLGGLVSLAIIPVEVQPVSALPCLFLLAALAVPPLLRHVHARWVVVALVALQALCTLWAYGQVRAGESGPPELSASERLLQFHWPMAGPSSQPPGPLPDVETWEEVAWNTSSELPEGTLGLVLGDVQEETIGRLLYESGRVEARWDLALLGSDPIELCPFPSRAEPAEEPRFRHVLATEPLELEGRWVEIGRWPLFSPREAVLYEVR
ncbi:MAG TPA: hypothetical protein QGF58_03505 [Myxococcota bacterium]|nr:hypothetical protein [Myxococcota bacterium]